MTEKKIKCQFCGKIIRGDYVMAQTHDLDPGGPMCKQCEKEYDEHNDTWTNMCWNCDIGG